MTKKKIRVTRTRSTPSQHDRRTFPILVILVMCVVVLGMFQYTGLLVVGSVIFVGFFGWLWWTRRSAAAAATKMKVPARAKRKPRRH
jgi:Flp pilus assembly protein TadB